MTAIRTGSLRNKARGAADERYVAKVLGGTRHPADTGGPEDVTHPAYAIQVKGGKTVATEILREGMASARLAALGTSKLPAVVLVDRKGSRVQRYIVFPLEEYAAEYGWDRA